MDAGALLVAVALVLTVASFFRPEPLLAVAVLLVCVAVLVGVDPVEIH